MQSCTAKFSACIALLAAVTGFAPGHARTGPGLQPPCRSAPGQGLHSAGPQGWVIPGGCVPSACPAAAPQLPCPAGSPPSRRGCARQLSQATSQLLLSVRGDLRGARQDRGHPGGAEPQLGNRGRLDRVGGERGQGSGAICSSPARVPVGWGPAHTGTSTAGNGRGAAAGLAPVELESVVGARAVPGFPPSPARGTSRRDGDGNGAPHRHCHLPPAARPPGPCPTEGSPPGPRSPRWGCQGLCSGEYRHFTLNIKRRNRVCHIQESERG